MILELEIYNYMINTFNDEKRYIFTAVMVFM